MKNKKSIEGFGSLIKRYRLENQATLREVADELGFSPMYISDVENERRGPFTEDKIIKLANYFGIESKSLLDSAILSKKKLELGFENIKNDQKELALSLARRWENMDDDTISRINNILKEKN